MSTPKFTIQQLQEVAQAVLGVQAVEIVDDTKSDAEYDLHKTLAVIDENRKAIILPQYESELTEKATKAATGRAAGVMVNTMLNKFGATGITRKELEEKAKIEEQLELCLEKHNATFSKDSEALRAELMAQADGFNKTLQDKETSYKQQLDAKDAEYTRRDMVEYLASHIGKKSNHDGDNIARAAGLLSDIEQKAHPHWDRENRKLSFRDKNNKEVPLLNETKTKEIDVDFYEEDYAQRLGYRMKDARSLNPRDEMERRGFTTEQSFRSQTTDKDPRDAAREHILEKFK